MRSKDERLAALSAELNSERDFRAKCEAEATSQRETLSTLGTALGQRDLRLDALEERARQLKQQVTGRGHCSVTAPLLRRYCAVTAPLLRRYCAVTTPLLRLSRSWRARWSSSWRRPTRRERYRD